MDPGRLIAGVTVAVVVLAVAVVAVLTGAPGLGGEDAPSSVDELDDSDTPPGVSRTGGITDTGDLAGAHESSLEGRSYEAVLRVERTEREGGRSRTVTQNRTASVDADDTVLVEFVERTGRGEVVRDVWANGSAAVARAIRDGRTRYERVDPGAAPAGPAIGAVRQLLDAGAFRVDAVEQRGGRTVLVLTADEPAAGAEGGDVVGEVRNVTAYTGRAVVDRDGRIYELNGTVAFVDRRGRNVTADFSYRIRRVGGVDVDRPDWVGTALERTAGAVVRAPGGRPAVEGESSVVGAAAVVPGSRHRPGAVHGRSVSHAWTSSG